jgi:hypothetical protein
MELRKTVLGEQRPDFASSLDRLAGLYREMGLYEKAEPLYLWAMELQSRHYSAAWELEQWKSSDGVYLTICA